MNEYRISDVNGIADLTIRLDGPGVYVARGPNGAGKSSAIEALKAASGDDKAKAEPSDGEDKGKVEVRSQNAEGVLLAVGSTRNKRTGLPTVRLVSTGAIGQLIDPGIKDADTAAKHRLKALLQLMPLPADDAAKLELTANDEELQKWIQGDPSTDAMDLAEAVRKRANELANNLEKRSAEAKGEEESLTGLIKELGALDFEAGDSLPAKQEADRAIRFAERSMYQAQARAKLEEQQAALRNTQGPRPNTEPVEASIRQLSDQIAELDRQIAVLKETLHHARVERARLDEAARIWDSQAAILNQKAEGPTLAEAAEFTKQAEAAAGKALRAQTLDRAKEYQTKANAAKELAAKCAERAKHLRGIAQGTADALGRLLERRGLDGLVIQDGRLGVKAGHSVKDFDTRLSFGERVRVALGIALTGLQIADCGLRIGEERLPILPLEPTFWLALDDVHKAEVCSIAKERGVCLVTEEPVAGPLRVEKVP